MLRVIHSAEERVAIVKACVSALQLFAMSVDLSFEPIMDTGTQHFCVEVMKRLDIERKNEQFCDLILEVGSGDEKAC